jgi:hypothetical protein
MRGDIIVHDIYTLPDAVTTLQVISIEDSSLSTPQFYVRLKEGDECADEPFEDYPQACAHWRNCLRQMGIVVPYQAPVAEINLKGEIDAQEKTATEVYYHYHSLLAAQRQPNDEATRIRDCMIQDPDFVRFAQDILLIVPEKAHDWISASMRVCCKRVAALQRMTEFKALEVIPGFGSF